MFLLVSSNLLIEKKVNLTLKNQHNEKLLACLLLVIMNLKRYPCK